MSFNFKALILIFLSLSLLVSCAKEDETYYRPIELNYGSCVSNLKKYGLSLSKVSLKPREINLFWGCANKMLNSFSNVIYNEDDKYTAETFKNFIDHYLGKGKNKTINISLDGIKALFLFKPILVGGSELYFTKKELIKLESIIDQLLIFTHKIQPNLVKWIYFKQDLSQKDFDTLLLEVKVMMNWVQSLIIKNNPKMTFSYMLNSMAKVDNAFNLNFRLENKRDFINKIKNMFLTSDNNLTIADWKNFFKLSHALMDIAFLLPSIQDNNFESYEDFDTLILIFNKVGNFFSLVFNDNKKKWTAEDLTVLIKAAKESKIIQWSSVTPELINSVWTLLFDKLFPSQQERHLLDNSSWSQIMAFINRVGQNQKTLIESRQNRELWPNIILNFLNQRQWSIQVDNVGRLNLSSGESDNEKGISYLNIVIESVSHLVSVYDSNENQTISTDELKTFIRDLNPIFQSLCIELDIENSNYELKVYREASLFTSSSDGDGSLNQNELTDYLFYVYSGYSSLQVVLSESDCLLPSNEMSKDCFFNTLIFNEDKAWESWPHWLGYIKSLTTEKKASLYNKLFQTVSQTQQNDTIELMDRFEFFVLVHYIETVLQRFDFNKDGHLQITEVNQAYNLFEKIFRNLTGMSEPLFSIMAEANFTYLMKKGRLPKEDSLIEKLEFLYWARFPNKRQTHASRGTLSEILYMLSQL